MECIDLENRKFYPRPDMYRNAWQSLDGIWKFAFDDRDEGLVFDWKDGLGDVGEILVPFSYQSRKSGIGDTSVHNVVWYEREIHIPYEWGKGHVWLYFGAVDHDTDIWGNGQHLMHHRGGFTPFEIDITGVIDSGCVKVVVRCEDRNTPDLVRGKQHWLEKTDRCWYTATSGIWQSVWMYYVPGVRVNQLHFLTDIDRMQVQAKAELDAEIKGTAEWKIYKDGNLLSAGNMLIDGKNLVVNVQLNNEDPIDNNMGLWSPECPNLYDFVLTINRDEIVQDEVAGYFGIRKISIEKGKICLNHEPYFQKLVLDQGYWKDSLMTPPDADAIIKDIQLTKEMGFNGVRKHQKLEDPRFLYYADVIGLIVWEEIPSAYQFTDYGSKEIVDLLMEMVNRDYNHPCIVTWLLFNESWGIRNVLNDTTQQDFGKAMYYLVKSLDGSRLVSTNDGWEALPADIIGIHDYEQNPQKIMEKYSDKEKLLNGNAVGKKVLAFGTQYKNEPVLITEYGGIALEDHKTETWGYNGKAENSKDLETKIDAVTRAFTSIPWGINGFCYTQLTDVEQETNGLLDSERNPKIDPLRVERIINKSPTQY